MRDLLLGSTRASRAAVRAAARAAAVAFVAEQRALLALYTDSSPEQREFVAWEVGCLLHLSPATGSARLDTALQLHAQPRLLAALEHGALGVPHALTLLAEVEHLDPPRATRVLSDVLDNTPVDDDGLLDATPGQLRAAARRAAIRTDPEATRQRHAAAARRAGVRARPGVDGMGQVIIDCTAAQTATTLAAVRGRAKAMTFDDPDLTAGRRQVAALMQALSCERVGVTAVIECPVERAPDLPALAGAPVWSTDVRMPAAVALGLSQHPAVLTGYGPIDADQARAAPDRRPRPRLRRRHHRRGPQRRPTRPAHHLEPQQQGERQRPAGPAPGPGRRSRPSRARAGHGRRAPPDARRHGDQRGHPHRPHHRQLHPHQRDRPAGGPARRHQHLPRRPHPRPPHRPRPPPAPAPPPPTTCRTFPATGTAPSTPAGTPSSCRAAPCAGPAPAAAPTTDDRSAHLRHPSHQEPRCHRCREGGARPTGDRCLACTGRRARAGADVARSGACAAPSPP